VLQVTAIVFVNFASAGIALVIQQNAVPGTSAKLGKARIAHTVCHSHNSGPPAFCASLEARQAFCVSARGRGAVVVLISRLVKKLIELFKLREVALCLAGEERSGDVEHFFSERPQR